MEKEIIKFINSFRTKNAYLTKLEKIKKSYLQNCKNKGCNELINLFVDYYECLLYDMIEYLYKIFK